MKKLFCFVLFLISMTIYSQGIVKAKGVGFLQVTTTDRNALSVPSGENWQIYNVTTGQYEYWDGDSWEPFPAGVGGGSTAASISYDNTISGLSATTVKAALDELDQAIEDINFIDGTYLETDNNTTQSVIGTVDFDLLRAAQGIMRFDRPTAVISGQIGYNTFGINNSGQWFLGRNDSSTGALFDVNGLTANRIFNLPDNAGTIALTTDIPSGINALNDVGDVVLSNPSSNQVLTYNGTNWVNQNASGVSTALEVSFNNATSGMSATTVQAALDELSDDKISSNNTGLTGAEAINNFVAISLTDYNNLTVQQQNDNLFLITDDGSVGAPQAAADISFVPYATITSTNVQAALQELKDEVDVPITAGDVSFTPYLTIGSTNVQSALQELKDELNAGGGSGVTALSELSDVSLGTLGAASRVLAWNGSVWTDLGIAPHLEFGDNAHPDANGIWSIHDADDNQGYWMDPTTKATYMTGGGIGTEATFTLDDNLANLNILSGTGTRMVVADPSGNLSTQAVPAGSGNDFVTGGSLTGTNLTLTVPNQTDPVIDLSGLQDGTGTDDQTATEVSYNNVTSGMTATDVQAAIDEIDATLYADVGAYTVVANATAAVGPAVGGQKIVDDMFATVPANTILSNGSEIGAAPEFVGYDTMLRDAGAGPNTRVNNNVIDLSNYGGLRYVASANAATTYTTQSPVIGGWAKILINAASEPTVTGATKVAGADFTASTNMFLVIYTDDGAAVEYFFLEK